MNALNHLSCAFVCMMAFCAETKAGDFPPPRTEVHDSIRNDLSLPAPDSLTGQITDTIPSTSAKTKKGLLGRILGYFSETNKPAQHKGLDFSIIGGPYYSSDTKFGVGLVAAGLYRTSSSDTVSPPSNVSLYLKATTSCHFEIGLRGDHLFPQCSRRIIYNVNFASIKSKFWGIGYDSDADDANESGYRFLRSNAEASFQWQVARNLFIGPLASFDYVNGRDFAKPWLWDGEDHRTFNFGAGFTVQYDSRDCFTEACSGLCLRLDQRFNPRFLLNRNAFSLTSFRISSYNRLWKSAVLATQFRSVFTYGDTPWGLLPTLGGSDNMRGYFEGRYRDKCEMDLCLELRQHIWHRSGAVVWAGAGTVFPSFKALRWRKILPNYGIGYRWEFKKRVNVRVDLGFGRHQTGFIFSINEAF